MIREENKNGGVLYATIVIVIILELLAMFSYFSNSVRAEPLLEKKNMQVQRKGEKQPERNKIIIKTELTAIDQLLGEYATNFDSSKINRAANIELAARLINNYKLKPGALHTVHR